MRIFDNGQYPPPTPSLPSSSFTLCPLYALHAKRTSLSAQSFQQPPSPHVLSLLANSISASQLDKIVGLAMLVAASVVFLYYTIWTLLMPFVDDDHLLQNFFPPRVWAIRIPVIIILLGSAVVGSFLGMVMIRSNKKKAAKAKAAAKKTN
ncbi:hypothetical protein ACJ41O_004055 [Fusarium nematophilum]